jgi:Fic family protein
MEQIAKALELKSELEKLRSIGAEQEAIIMQKFRLDWDYHSNHLEGNSLTYGETKALILFGITAQGKPLKDHIEITGHDEAIKWVTEIVKGDYPLTEKFIRELHIILLKQPYEADAITPDGSPGKKRIEVGKYKTTPNHVKTKTGEIFRFATPEETPALMYDLVEWYHRKKETPDVNPIILAAEFHYRFIRIHPFDDGNGRIARILMNFILMQYGYPPVIIKTDDKANYFSALQQADSGMIEPFIDYIGRNLLRSLEIMIAGAKGESIEEPDDLDKEIALLEKKLKAVGKEIETTKTKEAIQSIYDYSIDKVWPLFIKECQKFDNFYVHSRPGLIINDKIIYPPTPHNSAWIRKDIDSGINNLGFLYSYNSFDRTGFDMFDYDSMIKFEFKSEEYSIIAGDLLIEKLYGQQLNVKEINGLIQAKVHQHRDFIIEKLKAVESKKGRMI